MISIGCGNKMKDVGDLGETRKVGSLSITPKKVSSEPGSGENKILAISFSVKNEGGEVLGIGAGDFYIKDSKGKEHSIDGKQVNFGQDIKEKETIKGKAYFIVPDTYSTITLIYKPDKVVEAEWKNVRIP